MSKCRSHRRKPTRVKLVAVIERLELTTRYRMMPEGKPVPVEQVTEMTGSVMGSTGRIHTTVSYSEHRPVR